MTEKSSYDGKHQLCVQVVKLFSASNMQPVKNVCPVTTNPLCKACVSAPQAELLPHSADHSLHLLFLRSEHRYSRGCSTPFLTAQELNVFTKTFPSKGQNTNRRGFTREGAGQRQRKEFPQGYPRTFGRAGLTTRPGCPMDGEKHFQMETGNQAAMITLKGDPDLRSGVLPVPRSCRARGAHKHWVSTLSPAGSTRHSQGELT